MLLKVSVPAVVLAALSAVLFSSATSAPRRQPAGPAVAMSALASGRITQGALLVKDRDGRVALECPLKYTDVQAEISGPIARVTVTQDFENKSADKIEAVYVFPLPHKAAVDGMTLHIG